MTTARDDAAAVAEAHIRSLQSGGDPDWAEPTAAESAEIERLSALAAGIVGTSEDAEVARLVALAETIS